MAKVTTKEANAGPTPAEVRRVLKLRKQGVSWLDIIDQMGKPRQFILQVRPLMKNADPESVRPSYDRNGKKVAAKPVAKKARAKVAATA